jgi:hypothetical protein
MVIEWEHARISKAREIHQGMAASSELKATENDTNAIPWYSHCNGGLTSAATVLLPRLC